ncbi:MAG: hypothetical protein J6M41_09150 [Prevotella sp.]|nr:hypothetical protein [Prevotella sp.]
MEHLSLEIFDTDGTGSKYAMLQDGASVTFVASSEIFASGDVWSFPFTLNVYANAHIFGTAGEIHGARLHEQINSRRARMWVEGLPLYLGYLKLDGEATVDAEGNVDVVFESGHKTFDEMIEGAKANQVPMIGNVQFGIALWRKRLVNCAVTMTAHVKFADGAEIKAEIKDKSNSNANFVVLHADGEDETTPTQQYPRLVFPKGRFFNRITHQWENHDFLNTDSPYTEDENGTPTHPYCNVALCYQKYGYEKINDNGDTIKDYTGEPEAQRGYEYMPANRVNSAPNFFVIYWLRALMDHLGIHIEENQMMDVEDLRRLFFVNTACAYEEPKGMRSVTDHGKYGIYNNKKGLRDEDHDYVAEMIDKKPLVAVDKSKFRHVDYKGDPEGMTGMFSDKEKTIEKVTVEVSGVKEWTTAGITPETALAHAYLSNNRYFHDAFATSDCFPGVEISEVIKALESGFGMRMVFDDNYQRVRIVLLRNIFRSSDVQDIKCDITADYKTENPIRGFRMTYGDSEDTHFYYKGFADMLPHKKILWPDNSDKHDYSHWKLDAVYASIIKKVSAFDKTCYVTPPTGNAYGIKVDKDAKRYDELHPSLFEYAGFMDAEDGDCTGEDGTIETVSVGFSPAIMNDLNMEKERDGTLEQKFALFIDETMRPRRPDLGNLTPPESYDDSDAEYDTAALYSGDSYKGMMHGGVVKPGEFSIQSEIYTEVKDLAAEIIRTKKTTNDFINKIKWDLDISIGGYICEGYRLYLQDNYEPNDDGVSPIEKKDWGLTLGIMRGSGSGAHVRYEPDTQDGEGNDKWDIMPGGSVTAHPDTCDNYGNLWDYDGSVLVIERGTAIEQMQQIWPDSNISLIYSSGTTRRDKKTYISSAVIQGVTDAAGERVVLLFATALGYDSGTALYTGKIRDYARRFNGMTRELMKAYDADSGFGILVEAGSSAERMRTLLKLQKMAFVDDDTTLLEPIYIDNGVGSLYGRFSLKLRAEKPNPEFDPKKEEDDTTNRRYLEISNHNLRGRGLCDQFYKEYSYFIRNSRTYKCTVSMELAQLLAIDKTVRVKVGDVTGFVRKMQFSVSKDAGLGMVDMEIMYI